VGRVGEGTGSGAIGWGRGEAERVEEGEKTKDGKARIYLDKIVMSRDRMMMMVLAEVVRSDVSARWMS